MGTFTTLTCSCLYVSMTFLLMLTLFLPSHIIASYDYSTWIEPPSPTMPRNVSHAAVGYSSINNRIWILGSYDYCCEGQQLMSYDIDSDTFTDYGATALSHPIEGQAEVYTQIGDTVYMIASGNPAWKIATFNVNTAVFTDYYQNIILPQMAYLNGGCLASTEGALFVLGGGPNYRPGDSSTYDYVQVLNLTTRTWMVSPEIDYLSKGRKNAACVVHPYNNALYVMGGHAGPSYAYGVIKLYVGDLAHLSQYHWETIYGRDAWHRQRSVVYK
eukprot:825808_1